MKVVSVILVMVLFSGLAEPKHGWKKKHSPHWSKNHHEHESGQQDIEKEKEKDDNHKDKDQGNNSNNQGKNDGDGQSGKKDPFRHEIPEDPEKAFQVLADQVIAHDQLTAQYCEKNSHKNVTEMYGTYNYKLFVPLKNFDMDLIQIKMKHRVVYIKAEVPELDPRWQDDDDSHFDDIRRLPHFLDVKKATWTLKGTRIEITIPYKFFFNRDMEKTCEGDYKTEAAEWVVPESGTGAARDVDQSVIDDIFGGRSSAPAPHGGEGGAGGAATVGVGAVSTPPTEDHLL